MNLLSALIPVVGPIILRILAVLGLGVSTFVGVDTSLQGLINNAQTLFGELPATILAYASIAGFPKALGIITGAMTFRLTLWVAASATRFTFGGK